jgi:hypothetical protein
MKNAKLILAVLSFTVAGLVTGCYPDKIDYIDEYDLAGTHYDEEVDFSQFSTFHLVDTIIHVTEDGEDDPNLDREHDEFILELIRENMLDLGYTEVVAPDSLNRPDVALLVEAMTVDWYTYYSYWYDYWGWYPGWGWWGPGYPIYPGYPWYPGGGYYNSYTTGTLIIEMLDTDIPANDDPPNVVWMGLIDGILTYSGSGAQARLEKQINQVFDQSPYLQQ